MHRGSTCLCYDHLYRLLFAINGVRGTAAMFSPGPTSRFTKTKIKIKTFKMIPELSKSMLGNMSNIYTLVCCGIHTPIDVTLRPRKTLSYRGFLIDPRKPIKLFPCGFKSDIIAYYCFINALPHLRESPCEDQAGESTVHLANFPDIWHNYVLSLVH